MLDKSHIARRRAGLITVLATLCSLTAVTGSAAVPTTIQVQGVVQTAAGVAADGTYSMTFALHPAAEGAATLWTEPAVKIAVTAGRFRHVLGKITPISANALKGSSLWLSARVGADPALPRSALHSVAFARRAAVADALQCTGCVGVAALKFDSDVNLGANALLAAKVTSHQVSASKLVSGEMVAKKLTIDAIVAKSVAAATFTGDGSKLTGIKTPSGSCGKGEAVVGIKADGSLACGKAATADSLPNDALDTVSNGQLTTKFVDTIAGAKTPIPIIDNNPIGTSDTIEFPDVGVVRALSARVKLTNSDLTGLEVALFDPENNKHVLVAKGKISGKTLDMTWPKPSQQASGDLGSWVGKNAKGKWRLLVTDTKFLDNKTDGQIDTWHLSVHTLSTKMVEAKGKLLASGGLVLQNLDKAPFACSAAHSGYIYYETGARALRVCNGEEWGTVGVGTLGSESNPAQDCKQLRDAYPQKPSGAFWLTRNGATFKAWCDMKTAGGGWTLLLTLTHPRNQYAGSVHPLTVNLNTSAPSPKQAYSRDWRAIFTPKKGTELLMKRGTTGDWARFVVDTFCGFDSTDKSVCSGCHGTYASGCVYDMKGAQVGCGKTWLNSCSVCGGCKDKGCDTLGFNVNHDDYAALYNDSMQLFGSGWHGAQCDGAWGKAKNQGNVFPQTVWIR